MSDLWAHRTQVEIWGDSIGRAGHVIRYGHYGRPVIAFPTELGRAWEWETKGMLGALGPLIEAGRIKLYCVDAFDTEGWSDRSIDIAEQARRELAYQDWITGPVAAWIGTDSPGATSAIVTGASLGAYRALTLALRRPDLFPTVIGLSGNYDPTTWHVGRRERARGGIRGQPDVDRARPRRRPPRLGPSPPRWRPRRGAGRLGDRADPGAALDPADGGVATRQGAPSRGRRVGF